MKDSTGWILNVHFALMQNEPKNQEENMLSARSA